MPRFPSAEWMDEFCDRLEAQERIGEVAGALEEYGLPVFKALTTQRVAYPTTAARGGTVFEEVPGDAANEVEALKQELEEFVHGA
jgi:chromosome partitioning protein